MTPNIHATAVLLGVHGVLIRGPSGAGKSLLALLLLESFSRRGDTAVLVADDRVDLVAGVEGIAMSPPDNLAGLIELRGRGIVRRAYRSGVRLHLVVDLVPDLERMPEDDHFWTDILGHTLPRCPVPQAGVVGLDHQRLLIEEALSAIALPPGG
ncbi:serine/threonine protein kinase [Nostoc sp. 3335mG]|nr:serine/threonine protein kinase [Nostoc sp. 3335mG]